MDKKVISQINFEIEQISTLLSKFHGFLQNVVHGEPDPIELAALASILHSFYTGLEKIFLSIAKGIEADVPTGGQWHRDLLRQMGQSLTTRPAVLSPEVIQKLLEYLGFRHFYRHAYSFVLNWVEIRKLVVSVDEVWNLVRKELENFVDNYSNENDSFDNVK